MAPTGAYPHPGSGMLTRLPFGANGELSLPLGSTNPCPIDGHMEPYILHFSLQRSRLNSCYYHQDLHRRRLRPRSRTKLHRRHRALLLVGAGRASRRPSQDGWNRLTQFIFIFIYIFIFFSSVFSVFHCILCIVLYSLYCSVFSVLYCFHCIVLYSLFCTVFTVLFCIHCIALYSLYCTVFKIKN